MLLPDEAIDEFMEIWKRQCGEEISEEYAAKRAHEVANLFRLLATPPSGIGDSPPAESAALLEGMRSTISVEDPKKDRRRRTEPE